MAGRASATIEDVAREAQVSVATVSRALRGLPNVAPSTRARVLGAAQRLHYVADPTAVRLAGGRRLALGLVVPMLGQWFYSRLYSGIETVATLNGYDVLPFAISGPSGTDRFLERLPYRKRVDGLILADVPFETRQFDRVVDTGEPVVTLGTLVHGTWGLAVDNVAVGRTAVEHLVRLGHRRIAIIGGLEDDPFHFSIPLERYRGYREALEAAGLPVDPVLSVPGHFSADGGAEAMHILLERSRPPTAVFACSDEMAIGAMQVARDAGLRVPEDLSVLGVDGHDLAAYVGLTTIEQDVTGQGEKVAELLLDRLRRGDDPGGDVHLVHPARLVVRRTTAQPPADGAHDLAASGD
jgi:LacI family transcriptional regulator, repressor for deo operon, udp, cdd, tsx, nupC, and nupG